MQICLTVVGNIEFSFFFLLVCFFCTYILSFQQYIKETDWIRLSKLPIDMSLRHISCISRKNVILISWIVNTKRHFRLLWTTVVFSCWHLSVLFHLHITFSVKKTNVIVSYVFPMHHVDLTHAKNEKNSKSGGWGGSGYQLQSSFINDCILTDVLKQINSTKSVYQTDRKCGNKSELYRVYRG